MSKKSTQHLSKLLILFLFLSILTGCGPTDPASGDSVSPAEITPITVNYTSEDMDSGWDPATASAITLNGSSISVSGPTSDSASALSADAVSVEGSSLTIKDSGTYVISGKLADGRIIVDAGKDDTVKLVLKDAEISSSDNAPIYAKQAKKTILTLAEGSSNMLQDGEEYANPSEENEPDAAVFSTGDLTINGTGSLIVKANFANGIGTKDDLIITGGNLTVTSVNDGLRGRDSIAVKEGTIVINAGGDGLQANNDEDSEKGWISLDGGELKITAENDGIQAETMVQIIDGKITCTTGGGSANASTQTGGEIRPGWGQWSSPEAAQTADASEDNTTSAKGIKSGTATLIKGGLFSIDSSDDSIHSNGQILIEAGELALSSGDDGIHADSSLIINGGTIHIAKSYEGLESTSITLHDGKVYLTASDDGLNAAGGNDGSAQGGRPGQNDFSTDQAAFIRITGGYISIDSGGDGIDSNGALYISGGTVLVNGPTNNGNGAMDYNGICEVTGGILAIAGSSGMAQAPGDTSTQNSLLISYSALQKAGTLVTLADESGDPLLAFAPSKDYQSILISTPELEQGKTYTLLSGGTADSQLSDGLVTGGNISGNTRLTELTLSATVTSISDDGSPVSAGMRGSQGGPGPGIRNGRDGHNMPGRQNPPAQKPLQ